LIANPETSGNNITRSPHDGTDQHGWSVLLGKTINLPGTLQSTLPTVGKFVPSRSVLGLLPTQTLQQ